jgi:hypothetical protein
MHKIELQIRETADHADHCGSAPAVQARRYGERWHVQECPYCHQRHAHGVGGPAARVAHCTAEHPRPRGEYLLPVPSATGRNRPASSPTRPRHRRLAHSACAADLAGMFPPMPAGYAPPADWLARRLRHVHPARMRCAVLAVLGAATPPRAIYREINRRLRRRPSRAAGEKSPSCAREGDRLPRWRRKPTRRTNSKEGIVLENSGDF